MKVWWRCRVVPFHVWEASPAHHTDPDNPRGCPYSPKPCGCVQAHPEYNLATERPYLKDEWHLDNEKGPEEYLPQSNYRAKWLCLSCNEAWETPIQVRYLGSDCPNCSIAQRSKTEIWLAFELAAFLPGIDPTLNAKVATRNVDILSEPLKLVIEYDGHRYHANPEKDTLRGEELVAAGYRVLTLRESPLSRVGEYSLVVNGQAAFKYPHRLAAEVLEYLEKRMSIPVADLAQYRADDLPRARKKADAFIAGKKQRYANKNCP